MFIDGKQKLTEKDSTKDIQNISVDDMNDYSDYPSSNKRRYRKSRRPKPSRRSRELKRRERDPFFDYPSRRDF